MSRTSRPRPLTARQGEVLRFVAAGLSNKQIADGMGISENGVKRHLASLFAKYHVDTRAALVHQALGGISDEAKLFELLRSTLAGVLGQPATDVLLRRAAGPTVRLPNEAPDGEAASVPLPELVGRLWDVLFATTGGVVVRRLERAGFHPEQGAPMEER